MDMSFTPLSEKGERISRKTVDLVPNAFGIHKALGPGKNNSLILVPWCLSG
jgi:hypothetical protein